jgi:hypothetical protein
MLTLKRKERSQPNFILQQLNKKKILSSKTSRRKEIIKIRADSQIENTKTVGKKSQQN